MIYNVFKLAKQKTPKYAYFKCKKTILGDKNEKMEISKKLICSLLISSQFLSFSALPGAVYALT